MGLSKKVNIHHGNVRNIHEDAKCIEQTRNIEGFLWISDYIFDIFPKMMMQTRSNVDTIDLV